MAYYNLLINKNKKRTQGKLTIYTKVLIYAKVLKNSCYITADTYLVSCIIILDKAFSKRAVSYLSTSICNNLKHMFYVYYYIKEKQLFKNLILTYL